jgi:hypothetical protein
VAAETEHTVVGDLVCRIRVVAEEFHLVPALFIRLDDFKELPPMPRVSSFESLRMGAHEVGLAFGSARIFQQDRIHRKARAELAPAELLLSKQNGRTRRGIWTRKHRFEDRCGTGCWAQS